MTQEPQVKQLGAGVTQSWVADGRIPVFTIPDVNRTAIDVWANSVLAYIDTFDPDTQYLILHDISAAGMALTPYVRTRSQELAIACAPLHGRLAAVMSPGPMSQLVGMFLKHELRQKMRNITSETFGNRDEAIAWLVELL